MKILLITAGAGGMYCGSCLRDNALAAALMAKGHDVLLLPLYTPTRTDEPNVSDSRVFFGGISVYLEQRFPIFRRTPAILDRLWDSATAINIATGRAVKTSPEQLGQLTVSMLQGEKGFQSKEFEKLIRWLSRQSAPEVINLPNSLLISLAGPLKKEFKRPLFCTLQGEDLFLQSLQEGHRSRALELIRSNLEFVDAFIAVSHFHADFMSDLLAIPPEKMFVTPLGVNPDGYGQEKRARSGPFKVGYLARIAPEKGLHVLCDAYRYLRESGKLPASRLEVAGSLTAEHEDYLEEIRRRIGTWGLTDEFRYHGMLDRTAKISFLHGLDVFSVPATYDEPKGLFVLEAMAAGVPVVQPRRGAFIEVIDSTSGGILVNPDSAESLAQGILSIYEDADLADRLAMSGREAVRTRYSVTQMADRVLECYARFL